MELQRSRAKGGDSASGLSWAERTTKTADISPKAIFAFLIKWPIAIHRQSFGYVRRAPLKTKKQT
jgi:hypothetical protein